MNLKEAILSSKQAWLYATGKSYFHVPQGVGKRFVPDKLEGYFNDMTHKTHWEGQKDDNGIPLITLSSGKSVYSFVTIIQKALGHYDKWLLQNSQTDHDEFLRIVDFMLDTQDELGGWDLWSTVGVEAANPYSGMLQGESCSAFARAFLLTGNERIFDAAMKSLELMITPVEKGGTCFIEGESLYFEERPELIRNTILNGWIFALFGIYDLWLITSEETYMNLFTRSVSSLIASIEFYDRGYWSNYDLRNNIANPFYHNLHIAQIRALYEVVKDERLLHKVNQWETFGKSRLKKARAVLVKVRQRVFSGHNFNRAIG